MIDLNEEMAVEALGLDAGERRYINRQVEAYSHNSATGVKSVIDLMAVSIDWLAAELRVQLDEAAHTKGEHLAWVRWVEKIGPDVAAYLTLKTALDGIGGTRRLNASARALMDLIIDEVRAQEFRQANPSGFANAVNHGMNVKLRGARADRLVKRMRFHEVDIALHPGPNETMLVGTQLLGIMIEATGLFYIDHERGILHHPKKRPLLLMPTPETLEWVAKRDNRLRLLSPIHPPMVVPPANWAPGENGGYYFDLKDSLQFVRHSSAGQKLALANEPIPLVYSAVNTLQQTGWRINSRVFDVMTDAVNGKLLEVLPSPWDDAIPKRPQTLDEEELKDWRRIAADTHQRNARRRTKRDLAERIYTTSQQVRAEDGFYFPYSLDFRGRAYPAVEYLNPHGPDFARGLLEFADGIPLSEPGISWLAVHGANSLDSFGGRKLTRLSFQERERAIHEITPLILDIAEDPYSNRQWTAADAPWAFLQFASEWAEYIQHGTVVSHIPVGLDGTCNGLQHFSAMLRDPTGAKLVNLTDAPLPADIYSSVAESLVELFSMRWNDSLAAMWLSSGIVTRTLVKRPVMTLTYGATRYGFVDQILDTLRSKEELWEAAVRTFRPRGVKIREAVQYLSSALWEVLPTIVGGALSAMAWLQSVVDPVVSVTGGPISWNVPLTGFPARMEYWKPKHTMVRTLMAGTLVQPFVWHDSDTPAHRKIVNAISPNIVHSLDAAAMMATTVTAASRGVKSFSMIHDSYATHAEHIPIMADSLRTAFVELYSRDVLMELATQWRAIGAAIVDPPTLGDFNVRDVLNARYFFS